ncbi:MAG: nucleotidyl transferase AbiEii/AbiGii toxin family protein, partial [Candidatus Altiarchaeales archaeon]|nr:nucleotidyl transferase AbiEii/AbiGii toxin family protein [Candidatus Altiarchaeales archaeon]
TIQRLGDVGINGRVKEVRDHQKQKNIYLELRGPLFDGNPKNISVITVNISLKERPLYPPEQRMIFSQYLDIPSFDVFVMPSTELLSEKIRALLTRNKARDVYDVWFLLNKNTRFSPSDVNKKLKKHKLSFNAKYLTAKVDEKEKSWRSDLESLILGTLPEFKKVRKTIVEKITRKP